MFWMWFFGIFLSIGVLTLLFFKIWGAVFHVARHTVLLDNLPEEFDGFTLAVISDQHDRRFGKDNRRLAGAILRLSPDLVLTAGDMHELHRNPAPLFSLFSKLAQAGVPPLYAQGNHDIRAGAQNVTEEESAAYHAALEASGAILLLDSCYPVFRNGKCLKIYGQTWNSIDTGAELPLDPSCPSVAICHEPLQFDRLQNLPDLMISGHVHGGIFRIPFLGAVFAPGYGVPVYKRFGRKYFCPKYSRGVYQKGEKYLAVTQGVGYFAIPVRFLRPEILFLTLKSK